MPVDPSEATVTNQSQNYVKIKTGVYTFQIVDVVSKKNVETKWGLKNYFNFYLGVLNQGEYRGERIIYKTNVAFNDGFNGGSASALYTFACSVLDTKLNPESGINVNDLIGKRVGAFVKLEANKNGKEYSNIKETMPVDLNGQSLPSLTDEEIAKILPKPVTATPPHTGVGDEVGLNDLDSDDIQPFDPDNYADRGEQDTDKF